MLNCRCENCGQKYFVSSTMEGQTINCNRCAESFVIENLKENPPTKTGRNDGFLYGVSEPPIVKSSQVTKTTEERVQHQRNSNGLRDIYGIGKVADRFFNQTIWQILAFVCVIALLTFLFSALGFMIIASFDTASYLLCLNRFQS